MKTILDPIELHSFYSFFESETPDGTEDDDTGPVCEEDDDPDSLPMCSSGNPCAC